MTPNVSVLLQQWGVAEVIEDNLVQIEGLNMRLKDGTKVGYTKIETVEQALDRPWWLMHRAHLHEGLAEVARRLGADIRIDSRTTKGASYTVDLCVGADGVNSIVRRKLFPGVNPEPLTTNCAYRAIVPYSEIRKDPIARELIEKQTMEVWMAPNAYIITYPMSGGNMFNLVLSHHRPEKHQEDRGHDPRDFTLAPVGDGTIEVLVVMPKNVALMGDATHSMVNHMAQGAATSMEDGAFLVRCVVVKGKLSLREAVGLYEKERMPKAYLKQQVSFLNGTIWHLADGPQQQARDAAMAPESDGKYFIRSSNLYGDPQTVLDIYFIPLGLWYKHIIMCITTTKLCRAHRRSHSPSLYLCDIERQSGTCRDMEVNKIITGTGCCITTDGESKNKSTSWDSDADQNGESTSGIARTMAQSAFNRI